VVALESTALGLAKTIVQKAAAAWIADRRTTEVSKKELRELLTPWFRSTAPEQRILGVAVSDLQSFGRYEFRLDDGERAAALLAVQKAFERADLTDRALFAVDVDAAKLARRLRAGQPRAKTVAGLGEAGGAFYDAALDRCCELYVRAVVQVPAFVGRSSAEILSRISDLPDQVADRLSELPVQVADRVIAWHEAQAAVADQPGSDVTVAGWPLEDVTDPFVLEVHRPVEPDVPQPGLPLLPPYVPRKHDTALAEVVTAAAAGPGGIAVLVGGSSTGKTRACWQALELLRGQEPEWRLWHPIDPVGALAELPGIGSQTVVWLNEAQRYLDTPDGTGERVAARLRTLLRDQARGPVLVLATLWPKFWAELTTRAPEGADPHAQARELLAGRDIAVPAAFTGEQLRDLEGAGDPRLAQAAAGSRDGQVIQFLAGAPELLARYHNAPAAARALIDTAMDARRLGMGPDLPRAFLEAAAPGYLTDTDWDLLPGNWLERALAYTAKPSKGVRGPLTPIRPRPSPGVPASPGDGQAWQLADYLDQHGRRARRELTPPASFWAAAASYADPADLGTLGRAVEDRGLYRAAARLYKQASAHGNPMAGAKLVRLLHTLHPGDQRPADWATSHARLDDSYGVAELLRELREAGATGQVAALLDRDPAAHASIDDLYGVAQLLKALPEAEVTTLASRAAAHASLDNPYPVIHLLEALREAGATAQVTALLDRDPAAHLSLDDPELVIYVLDSLRRAGATGQVTVLLDRDPAAHASIDDPYHVAELVRALRRAGATGQVTALLASLPAAADVSIDDPGRVATLLHALRRAGATGQVTVLLDRDPAAHVSLDDPGGVTRLLHALRLVEATGQVTALLDRDPAAHVSLDHPNGVNNLLRELREAGATAQVAALLDRVHAAHVSIDDRYGVAELVRALRRAGASAQAEELIERLPAAGLFQLFCEQEEGRAEQFRFGREADGRPAGRWAWTDLG
jgi:hypothetical protein